MESGVIHRAKVTRATAAGVWITIRSVYPGVEFGPCDIVANAVRMPGDVTGLADFIARGHSVLALDVGNSDYVIVGTIRNGVSPTGDV